MYVETTMVETYNNDSELKKKNETTSIKAKRWNSTQHKNHGDSRNNEMPPLKDILTIVIIESTLVKSIEPEKTNEKVKGQTARV